MKNGVRRTFVSIPRRIMSVTSVKGRLGTQSVKLGWVTRCHECHTTQTFMIRQYDDAVAYTRAHRCYKQADAYRGGEVA